MFQESATIDSATLNDSESSAIRAISVHQPTRIPITEPDPVESKVKSKSSKPKASKQQPLSTIDAGIQLAAKLNRPGKIALIQAIEAMLEAEEDQMPEADAVLLRQKEAKLRESAGRGRIEAKFIRRNGKSYGPYTYLRWWMGKVYKSNYIGKG